MRKEKDFLGEITLPDNALYGIHAFRASENFPLKTAFPQEWYKAMGDVKLSVYKTYSHFVQALKSKNLYDESKFISEEKINALKEAAMEVSDGRHFEHFIVPALQGGAGTSINMNINEILSNRALQILGKKPGNYTEIDPIETANVYQSTNDVVPTALKIAVMRRLFVLEEKINASRKLLENLEARYRFDLRVAYTQMQAAVPGSFGNLFSSYNDALSRDWWRVSKALERIKVVNLGGGATGTSLAVPKFFVMEVVDNLKKITGLPLSRAENLSDVTANQDVFVEVHAILKSHAVNLEKIVSDLRLLAADVGTKEIELPQKQVGSSIMPGKINPVEVEYIVSIAHKIYANDMEITSLASLGVLELNPYLPSIGYAVLNSLEMLIAANSVLYKHIFNSLKVNSEKAQAYLLKNPSLCTALSPYVGYHKAAELAKLMQKEQINIFEANEKINLIEKDKLIEIIKPENLLKQGFSVYDLWK